MVEKDDMIKIVVIGVIIMFSVFVACSCGIFCCGYWIAKRRKAKPLHSSEFAALFFVKLFLILYIFQHLLSSLHNHLNPQEALLLIRSLFAKPRVLQIISAMVRTSNRSNKNCSSQPYNTGF